MKNIPTISVIIPSNHCYEDLLKIVRAICIQEVKPAEIIIVDSFYQGALCPTEIKNLCALHKLKLIYENREKVFPGQARNIGLSLSKAEIIAFIDVQTIPRPDWISSSLEILLNDRVLGVFGGTNFAAITVFEGLVRDAFHGVLPRKTLPGSVFKREVFVKAGQFIDWVRAGEDTEWMLRLELLRIPVVYPPRVSIDYLGLLGINMKALLKKWYRNYTASHDLPHLFPQKLFLWMVLYPLIIFVGFNWNYLVANWHMDSPLYIGHVTKMAAAIPLLGYLLTRGILLPYRRGVVLYNLFPIRFISIAGICFMADVVKAFVFTYPKFKPY